MTTLRAGLIGLGMMGANHARVLSSLDGVELVGVVDPVAESPLHLPNLMDMVGGMRPLEKARPQAY